jgi:hypothetical protein
MSKKQTLVSFRAERTDDGGWHLFASYGQEPSLSQRAGWTPNSSQSERKMVARTNDGLCGKLKTLLKAE